VRRKVLGQVVLAKESLLAHAALVRLNTRVPLLMSPHVGAIGKFHLQKQRSKERVLLSDRREASKTKSNHVNCEAIQVAVPLSQLKWKHHTQPKQIIITEPVIQKNHNGNRRSLEAKK